MMLQLDDNGYNLSESKFLRGLTAVATGGASEAARGIFGKKKGSAAPVCSCTEEKNMIHRLTKRLRACKKDTGWGGMKNRVTYNPQTGIARVETLQDGYSLAAGITDLVGGALKSTPYGAAASSILSVGKSLFGKKSSSSSSSGGSAASDAIAKVAAYTKENKDLKDKLTKVQANNKSLKMQRYYYGAGGLAIGIGAGMMLQKRS